jgi:hypothetical protein
VKGLPRQAVGCLGNQEVAYKAHMHGQETPEPSEESPAHVNNASWPHPTNKRLDTSNTNMHSGTASEGGHIKLRAHASANPVLHGTVASTAQTTWLQTAHSFACGDHCVPCNG